MERVGKFSFSGWIGKEDYDKYLLIKQKYPKISFAKLVVLKIREYDLGDIDGKND